MPVIRSRLRVEDVRRTSAILREGGEGSGAGLAHAHAPAPHGIFSAPPARTGA